ncbi:uncharacterized protein K452DRAFT_285947 [Aplosporella prunicola CBS 121167]|uniref:DUF4385 domain-containing protein n=1 Tax=Aplosporella prunicola CBS 121167 TaxID=1176127 RepID=A0A6A6BMW7_9PEZI|nr:uncharacterized protein K452DRAFT_285947 [Aplosporella prunicola CBS 121167]KAF2143911.1 hypothetical protein K452DRAFT_285947 [Aplosporella prunicola CBS 121167]
MATPTPKPTTPLRLSHLSYRIGRGETGVLTYEPYKSALLPLWRFRTPALARTSAAALYARFLAYDAADDFVGMDMARKFVQMGMTRAMRYANHAGGRKYTRGSGAELPKSEGHEGQEDKLAAAAVFRDTLARCRDHEGYKARKEAFLKEQRAWDRERKRAEKAGGNDETDR